MQKEPSLSASLVAGAAVGLLGSVMALDWLLQSGLLARLVPGGVRLGIATPLLFVLIGLCFAASRVMRRASQRHVWLERATAAGIGALVLLPLGYLFESLTDISLGIDVVRGGVVPTPANPYPGRISPNASVAFLLTGIAFWLLRRRESAGRGKLLLLCASLVLLIGFAGLAGHLLGLEPLYRIADFNRILPVTAIGFLITGAGLWAIHDQAQAFEVAQAQRRVQVRSVAVCALVAVSCGIAGFAMLRDTFEQSLSRNMLLTATTAATSLGHTIDVSLWFPRTVATRPTVTQTLDRIDRDPNDAAAREFLQKVADSFLTAEMTGVEFHDLRGAVAAKAGTMAGPRAQVVHPLRNAGQTASLAWDGSYILLAENRILAGDRVVGRVLTEQRMPLFDRLLEQVRSSDATSDAAICSRTATHSALCAATRFRSPSFELPLTGVEGLAAEGIAKALDGEQGVLHAKDPRDVAILGAYTPIKDFGIALGVKTDVDTLYAPLRSRFVLFVAALLLIVAFAIVALRSQIQPALSRLVESEMKMKGILEEQSELVSLAQPDGELVYVNPAYARHFGLTPAAMIGTNLYDHVEPIDREVVSATLAAVLQSSTPKTGENRMVTPGGAPRWVSWTNSVQRDAGGQTYLHSVGRDITERKRAENALAESQAILERTGRVAAIGGWELDLRTRALRWTSETRRIFELPEDHVPSYDTVIGAFAPEDRAVIEAAIDEASRTGSSWDLELPMTTSQGRQIWVRAQGQVESADGTPVRLVGAFQDITERKKLEQRLADSERFIRKVTDSLPVRIAYVDRETRFRFVNQSHCQRFGRSREEIIGRTRTELMHGVTDAVVSGAIQGVLQGREQRIEFEEEVAGKTVRIESRLIPDVGPDGEVQGFFTTGIDITERSAAERALRELTTIFDNTTDYVVQADWRGRVLYMNPAVRKALGISDGASAMQHSFQEFNTPETNKLFADVIVPAVKSHGVWIGETTVYAAEHRVVPVNHMVIAHRDRDGRVARYSAIMRDISDEVAAKQEQRRQAATLRSVTEAIPAIVAVVGADGRYRFANSGFERWAGTKRDLIVGSTAQEVLGRTEYERSRPWVEKALAGEAVNFEKEYPGRATARHLAIAYVPLWLESGEVDGYVAVAQDITRHKQEEVRLIHLTQRDALTGLLNRPGFEQFLEGALRDDGNARSIVLLYLDLDHFKPVNDTYGHAVGDEVLQQFAQRLSSTVRPTDAVARLGGDEFAIVLTGVRESAHAQAVAEKVVAAAQTPFDVANRTVQVGASVGIAFGAEATTGWRDLVARADAMLYQAKADGRGRHAGIV